MADPTYRDDLTAALARIAATETQLAEVTMQLATTRAHVTQLTVTREVPAVFVATGGKVVALDPASGAPYWSTKLTGRTEVVHVVYVVGRLHATSNGKIWQLDPATGVVQWTNPLRGLGWDLPTVVAAPDEHVAAGRVFVGLASQVLALDARTGQSLWQHKMPGGVLTRTFVQLALMGHTLIATSKGEVACLDALTGAARWHNKLSGYGTGHVSIAPAGLGQFALTAQHAADVAAAAAAAS